MWQLIRRFSAPALSEVLAGQGLDLNRRGRALLSEPRLDDGEWLKDLSRTLAGIDACWQLCRPLLGRRCWREVKRALAAQRRAAVRLEGRCVPGAWLDALAQHAKGEGGRRAVAQLGSNPGRCDALSAHRQAARLAALLAVDAGRLDGFAARACAPAEVAADAADGQLHRAVARMYRKAHRHLSGDCVRPGSARRWLESLVMAAELLGPSSGPTGNGFPGHLTSTGRRLLLTLPEFRWLEGLCEQEGDTAHVRRMARIRRMARNRRTELDAAIRRDAGVLFAESPQTFEAQLSWRLFCARNHKARTSTFPCGRLISPPVAD